ncbi:MAG: RidA family protein [Clostridia bacterium]|nr:RidA family protein [Clostridia bacterium]
MKQISTPNAPAAIGPYSQGLRSGNMVFISGQIPVDPATGVMVEGIEAQAKQALTNLRNVLAAAGLSTKNVIKTTVFLADLADFPTVNAIYETFFLAPYPARSCVQVAGIPKGALVEIECIAIDE